MTRTWTAAQKAQASQAAKLRLAVKSEVPIADAPTIEGGVVDLAAVMAMVKNLQDNQEVYKSENDQLRRQVVTLQAAQKQLTDEYGQVVDAAPPDDLSATIQRLQRAGSITEILEDAEYQARERGDKTFSRERLRRALNGEVVEDVNQYHCPNCGKLKTNWTSDADVERHILTECKKKH